jgi:hypothetical protein
MYFGQQRLLQQLNSSAWRITVRHRPHNRALFVICDKIQSAPCMQTIDKFSLEIPSWGDYFGAGLAGCWWVATRKLSPPF